MKKGFILVSILAALFSNPLLADEISGGPRVNMDSGLLTVPCVEVDDPESELDGRYFDVKFQQIGNSFDFIFGEEEDVDVCIKLIEASLNADEDTSDVNGDLGSTPDLKDLSSAHNKWTAKAPYPDSFHPFNYNVGISYAGPTAGRTVQDDMDTLVQKDGFKMLHIYHLFTDTSLTIDPDMKAVLDYAAAQDPKIEILVGTQNDLVTQLFQTKAGADEYVAALKPFLLDGGLRVIALGNEPNDKGQADINSTTFTTAAVNLRAALTDAGLADFPISVCLLYGGLTSYPPADAQFQEDAASYSMLGYIEAIQKVNPTKPYIFVNILPSYTVESVVRDHPSNASWYPQFGLFTSIADPSTRDGNIAPYWALADLQYNTVRNALDKVRLEHVQVYISETGWPDNGGGTYTTLVNEVTYVNNMLNLWVYPQIMSSNFSVPTFLFEAFDQMNRPADQAHWGIHYEDGSLKPGITIPSWVSQPIQ